MSGQEPLSGRERAASENLARRYQVLLLAYPADYRERRGGELLATLLDAASPRQRWPRGREAASIAAQGLRARLDAAKVRPAGAVWSEGLHRGALLLLGYAYAEFAVDLYRNAVAAPVGVAILTLALCAAGAAVRDHRRVALLLTVGWLAVSTTQSGLSWSLGAAVVALAVPSARFRSPRQVRSSGWVLVPALFLPAEFVSHDLLTNETYVNLAMWLADGVVVGAIGIACLGLALDPRITIAVACLGIVVGVENTMYGGPFGDAAGFGEQLVFHPNAESNLALVLMAVLFLGSHLRSRQLART